MSLGWDSYFVAIDGRTASLFLDLDSPPDEIARRLPRLLFVRIRLHHPGDHGLSTDAELEELSSLERELEVHFERELDGKYVGRFTHDGRRTYLIYVPTESPDVAKLLERLRARGYPAETWTEADAEWSRYFQWLYPAPEELQTIRDRRVIDQLIEAGDALTSERDVEHWCYFGSADSRADFVRDLSAAGYRFTETSPEGASFGVRVTTHHSVDIQTLGPVVRTLFRMASKHSGEYDGWETRVVTH